MTKLYIAFIIIALIIVVKIISSSPNETKLINNATSTVIPVDPNIPAGKWCVGGFYCDGTPVNPVDAGLGALICANGNKQLQCVDGETETDPPFWKDISAPCFDDMPGSCSIELVPIVKEDEFCTGGVYCDGDPVPKEYSFVGADPICGIGNYKYSCVSSLGNPRWRTDREPCDAGMIGKCN